MIVASSAFNTGKRAQRRVRREVFQFDRAEFFLVEIERLDPRQFEVFQKRRGWREDQMQMLRARDQPHEGKNRQRVNHQLAFAVNDV